MIRRYLLVFVSVLVFLPSLSATAVEVTVRDSIGPDSSLTDGLPGGAVIHDGGVFVSPGLILNPAVRGVIQEARFVIFARDEVNNPENDIANVAGNPMRFHLWTDGVQGGPDSFDENPNLLPEADGGPPNHVSANVNTSTASHISLTPFGTTGPASNPTTFTTFLVTADLSSFDIPVHAGGEYVMSMLQHTDNFITGGNARYRIIASNNPGTEDLFWSWDAANASIPKPGFLQTDWGFTFPQYAGALVIETNPPPTSIDPGVGVRGSFFGGSSDVAAVFPGGVDVLFDEVTTGGGFSADYAQLAAQQALADFTGLSVSDFNAFVLNTQPYIQVWDVQFDGDFDTAELVFGYDDEFLPDGFDEETLFIQHFEDGVGLTSPLQTIDTDDNTITLFGLTDFSPFILSTSILSMPQVPEPTAFALATLGLLSLGMIGRRRRRR